MEGIAMAVATRWTFSIRPRDAATRVHRRDVSRHWTAGVTHVLSNRGGWVSEVGWPVRRLLPHIRGRGLDELDAMTVPGGARRTVFL
ncbi:protein of unknown function (plasmid) [Pararobbsia alpina]